MAGGISDGVDAIIAALSGSGEEFTASRRQLVSRTLSEWSPVFFVGLFFIIMRTRSELTLKLATVSTRQPGR